MFGIWVKWGTSENWIHDGSTSKVISFRSRKFAEKSLNTYRQRMHGVYEVRPLPDDMEHTPSMLEQYKDLF